MLSRFALIVAISLATGVGYVLCKSSVVVDDEHEDIGGIDWNLDGLEDEVYTYADGVLSRVEVDRNFDGRMDALHTYEFGAIKKSQFDDNFNRTFESVVLYRYGQPDEFHGDLDEDGYPEHHGVYEHGVIKRMSIIDKESKAVVRNDHYDLGRVICSEIDSNNDGISDTFERYGLTGDVTPAKTCLKSTGDQ